MSLRDQQHDQIAYEKRIKNSKGGSIVWLIIMVVAAAPQSWRYS